MPIRERPCLEHMQQLGVRVGQPLASVLSMVFIHQPLFAQDDEVLTTRKPCLELVLPPGPPAGIRSAELEFAASTTLYTP